MKTVLLIVACVVLAGVLLVVVRTDRTGSAVSPGERAPVPKPVPVVAVSNAMPKLPAPKLKARPAVPPVVEAKGPETPKGLRELLEGYLAGKQRSAASLLAVSRITKDLALLDEAKQRFPGNPQVLLDWLLRSAATPEEKKQALNDLRKAAPDNAMGDYLFALQQFEAGDMDGAVVALWQGLQKPVADAYFMDAVRASEEAYLGVGYPPARAVSTAMWGMEMNVLGPMRQLADWTLDMQAAYATGGDAESARDVARMGSAMGAALQQQFEHGVVLEELVAIAIERKFLERLDPAVELVAGGQTAGARLNDLNALKEQIKSALQATTVLRDQLDESAKMEYYQQVKLKGELGALLWLQQMKKQ